MKLKLLKLMILPLLLSEIAMGGGADSGGGDFFSHDFGSAWFLGNREIQFCIDLSADFGPSKEEVRSTILKAADTWRQYLIDRAVGFESDGRRRYPEEFQLFLNLHEKANCDGSEDLKFFFGTTSPEVQSALKLFNDPAAIAYRQSYDATTRWGKGFIWMGKGGRKVFNDVLDWKYPGTLMGAILHELGHVLGCGHFHKTIMDEDIAINLLSPDFNASPVDDSTPAFKNALKHDLDVRIETLSEIDVEQSLILPKIIPGVMDSPMNGDPYTIGALSPFERFTGRKPVGKVKAQFEHPVGDLLDYILSFQDDLGITKIPFSSRGDFVPQVDSETPLFKVSGDLAHPAPGEPKPARWQEYYVSAARPGIFTTPKGENIPGVLLINQEATVELLYWQNDRSFFVFHSFLMNDLLYGQ